MCEIQFLWFAKNRNEPITEIKKNEKRIAPNYIKFELGIEIETV